MTSPTTTIRPAEASVIPAQPLGLALLRLQFRLQAALSTQWAFRSAWRLFTTPRRLPEKAWEAAVLAEARRFAVPGPTGALAAYEWNPTGTRTVLLVHGWEHRASFWGVLVRALVAAGYRVVAFDAPGHGASAGHRLTLPAYVGAVQAVADMLGPLHAVVAHSLGGATVVGGPVHFNTDTTATLPRLVLLAVPASTPAVARRFAEMLGLPPAVMARMGRYIREQHGRDAESFSLTQAGPVFPVGRALLLHDEHDESIPFAEARELAAAWPDLEFGATSGLGHNRIMREPAVLTRIVTFLS
ncbi:alpha/beta fold hydrolase [Hymenobacter terrestris]|uniref:Alpha/beta fold hydrolase n=1 Tax=Hymenobacter terrestris TaxID=2748310 RepID=A0ABX2Q057_9BACT|nr:alpha/beta fold hydrolase [Hymenobacter terrestris]NVO84304.1 alpha/beta fold hydrolase [Hymenobacter terrestris]